VRRSISRVRKKTSRHRNWPALQSSKPDREALRALCTEKSPAFASLAHLYPQQHIGRAVARLPVVEECHVPGRAEHLQEVAQRARTLRELDLRGAGLVAVQGKPSRVRTEGSNSSRPESRR
jgi:hypothetical protein